LWQAVPEAYPHIAKSELGVSTESLLSALRPSAMLGTVKHQRQCFFAPEGATWKISKNSSAHL
jgi:hypothetical protein